MKFYSNIDFTSNQIPIDGSESYICTLIEVVKGALIEYKTRANIFDPGLWVRGVVYLLCVLCEVWLCKLYFITHTHTL